MPALRVSVLVTTFGRRAYVERCVEGLLSQSRLPDEIILVTRIGDAETETWADAFLEAPHAVAMRRGRVEAPGVLAANRVGFPLATGDILCFTDDDAVPRPDWIERIERRFLESETLGAVGGRDVQHTRAGTPDRSVREVGRIRWYGRVSGNHHLSFPGFHEVEALKGCNMAYRRGLIPGFDEGIIGSGFFYEIDLCFAVRRAGYQVRYDSDILVDHYVEAPRMLAGMADPYDPQGFYFENHNRTYVMLKNLTFAGRMMFLVYSFARDGFMALPRLLLGRPAGRPRSFLAIFRGKISGIREYLHRRSGREAMPSAPTSCG